MDQCEANAGPDRLNAFEVTPRTVVEAAAEPTRIRRRPILMAVIAIGVAAIPAIDLVTSPGAAAGPEPVPLPHAAEYLPSISDLMIATIQPRHERLWQAEQHENWEFAAYELGNLRGAFNRLGLAHPVEHDISFPEMIASVTEQPFDELHSAIQARDGRAFDKAFADLTSACNSCHQALNHGVVEIRVPSRTSASDLSASATSGN